MTSKNSNRTLKFVTKNRKDGKIQVFVNISGPVTQDIGDVVRNRPK